MINHVRYGWYVARHKMFVLIAGIKIGAPLWQLIIHDLSKFTRAEWMPYVDKFYGPNPKDPEVVEAFLSAFRQHEKRNPHHWQHWTRAQRHGEALEMPTNYVYEMVADWMRAGRAINGEWEVESWYNDNREKIVLHPRTRDLVQKIILKNSGL